MKFIQLLLAITIPQTVTVRITGRAVCVPDMRYKTVEVSLEEYVKGVLPNEWLPGWPTQSLRAGAVAVKNYAVSVYNARGYLWDCNYDQVYNPSKRTPATDRAVDATWDYWIWNDGFVRTYYDDYPDACITRGQLDNCLSQWQTLESAKSWYTWRDMMLYDGVIVEKREDFRK